MFNEGDYVKFIGRAGGAYNHVGVTPTMEENFLNKIFCVEKTWGRNDNPRLSIKVCPLTENASKIADKLSTWIYTPAMFELYEEAQTSPLEFTYEQFLEGCQDA